MDRKQALEIIKEHVENKNIIKHMLATEAVMKTLAQKFEPGKEEEWGLAGLLHDGDYCESVSENMQGVQIAKWVEDAEYEIPENVKHAMAAHNAATGVQPESKMAWALFCGDSLTGLIVAATLVLPSRKLADLTAESVLKRFKESSFAKGTRREDILLCEEKLGIPMTEFVKITLKAMQSVSDQLGL